MGADQPALHFPRDGRVPFPVSMGGIQRLKWIEKAKREPSDKELAVTAVHPSSKWAST